MAIQLKITFTGGGNLGEDYLLDLARPRLLGRTHTADVVISKTDTEVSGRHLEFKAEGGGVSVTCLSRNGLELNGEKVSEGETRPIAKGDELRLGHKVRIRVDLAGAASAEPAGNPGVDLSATWATGAPTFTAKAAGADRTFATQGTAGARTFSGSVVETPVGGTSPAAARRSSPAAVPVSVRSYDPDRTMAADAVTARDAATGGSDRPVALDADSATFSGGTDGETQAMATIAGNMDVIRAIAEEKQRAKRFRQRLWTASAFAVLAVFGALVYWRWPRAERWLHHPQPLSKHYVKAASGAKNFYVDYPSDARTRTSERANGGVDIETLTGTARDVPMRLSLDVRRQAAELDLSLEESASRELEALRKLGYVFEPVGADGGFCFFERSYPKSCLFGRTQRGVRVLRREFARSEGAGQWRGVLFYFRNRDTAYRLLREIPDPEWPRGQELLRGDPSLAVFFDFMNGQWESPGAKALAKYAGRPTVDLLKMVDAALERNIPSEWRETGLMVDALMVGGLKGDAKALSEARTRLERLRKAKDLFYDECCARRDLGETTVAFDKAWGAFGNDAGDMRSRQLSDPSIWRRE